jgi:predicted enzyme related to lactoylglutathione lyase
MPHYSALRAIVIDVPEDDHDRELAFWQGAIGEELHGDEQSPEYHGARLPHEQQLGLLVQRLGAGPAGVHLDFHTDDVEAEVARLERLGATRERRVHDWYVMRDPAGLRFCVVPAPPRPGWLDDGNAQRWD